MTQHVLLERILLLLTQHKACLVEHVSSAVLISVEIEARHRMSADEIKFSLFHKVESYLTDCPLGPAAVNNKLRLMQKICICFNPFYSSRTWNCKHYHVTLPDILLIKLPGYRTICESSLHCFLTDIGSKNPDTIRSKRFSKRPANYTKSNNTYCDHTSTPFQLNYFIQTKNLADTARQ